MLLHRAKEFAEASAGQAVNEMVLIVPGYFNQAERQGMLQAADLAGFKVLQLMNDYTAGKTLLALIYAFENSITIICFLVY